MTTFSPPQEVRANAKRGLELRAKHGRGGTAVGVARARDLSNGKSLPIETIKRMVSYFARHEVDKQGEGWGKDSAGYIAWLLWGGDAGKAWANRIAKENEKKDKTMTNDFATSYAAIIKSDEQPDGTLMVYGKATDDSIDSDLQICDAEWLDRAMPQWFKSGGNVREQHSNIAAGVAKEYESKSDGHYIMAHVVDPTSVKKVQAGVLKGFSIGIKAPRVVRDTKAVNGRIIDGQIIEVSLVDRPANPNAKLVMAKSVEGESTLVQVEELHEYSAPSPMDVFGKREFTTEEREQAAEEGDAMPDGSYPIKNKKDLQNAIQAFGRAKNPAAVKRHIMRRARALGAENLLPDDWKKSMDKVDSLLNTAKELSADTVKFDKDAYDTARRALAQLIVVEANEMAESGSNEKDSIECLLDAVKHLFEWYEGEVEEGEVSAPEMVELATAPEVVKEEDAEDVEDDSTSDCECDGCSDCAEKGGCDDKMCKGHKSMKSEESIETSKCLECGCDKPADAHGRDDVTTAEMVELKSDEVSAEKADAVMDSQVDLIITKAVASATEAVKAEIDELRSALEAEKGKSMNLETELADAKTKAASGGPKRTGTVLETTSNDLLVKAAEYNAKATAATDPILAKGYRELAEDFIRKASKETSTDKE